MDGPGPAGWDAGRAGSGRKGVCTPCLLTWGEQRKTDSDGTKLTASVVWLLLTRQYDSLTACEAPGTDSDGAI